MRKKAKLTQIGREAAAKGTVPAKLRNITPTGRKAPPHPQKEGMGESPHLQASPRAKEVGCEEGKAWWYGAGKPICLEAALKTHMLKNMGKTGGGKRRNAPS